MDRTLVRPLTRLLHRLHVSTDLQELRSRGHLAVLTLASGALVVCISLSCVLSLLVDAVTGWLRPTTCFYWLALLSKNKLSNATLFLLIFTIAVIELMVQTVCPTTGSKSFVIVSLLYLITAGIVFLVAHVGRVLDSERAVLLTAYSWLMHIVTPESTAQSWYHFWIFAATGFAGIISARCTETLIGSQARVSRAQPESRSFVWRRRHSSPRKTMERRTSVPNLESGRSFSFHGTSVSERRRRINCCSCFHIFPASPSHRLRLESQTVLCWRRHMDS